MSLATEIDDLPASATRGGETQGWAERIALTLFIAIPLVALAVAVPVAWGGWLTWLDVAIALPMYFLTLHGITIGYHRLFTHKSFKPNRAVKIALAVLGSMAVEGPVVRWVADHRKHHKFSDRDGDPHSPWKYGESFGGLAKGLWWAHIGWLFDSEQTPQRQYAPDLMKDRDIVWISRNFWVFTLISLAIPPVLGGLLTWSWTGALTAFFWGTLVRVALLHHMTWAINSICHAVGDRPFVSRDKSANIWWLAIPSGGESWHNLHHADPTSARHGVLRGQLDTSARTIWALQKLGWVTDVRWSSRERIAGKLVKNQPVDIAA